MLFFYMTILGINPPSVCINFHYTFFISKLALDLSVPMYIVAKYLLLYSVQSRSVSYKFVFRL